MPQLKGISKNSFLSKNEDNEYYARNNFLE